MRRPARVGEDSRMFPDYPGASFAKGGSQPSSSTAFLVARLDFLPLGRRASLVRRALDVGENLSQGGPEVPDERYMPRLLRNGRHPLQRPRVIPDPVVAMRLDPVDGLAGLVHGQNLPSPTRGRIGSRPPKFTNVRRGRCPLRVPHSGPVPRPGELRCSCGRPGNYRSYAATAPPWWPRPETTTRTRRSWRRPSMRGTGGTPRAKMGHSDLFIGLEQFQRLPR